MFALIYNKIFALNIHTGHGHKADLLVIVDGALLCVRLNVGQTVANLEDLRSFGLLVACKPFNPRSCLIFLKFQGLAYVDDFA